MRRRALIVLAAVIMTLAMTNVAVAAVASHISIRYNPDTQRFHGRVTSPDAECEAGRTVKLFKKTADGRELQGKDLTNAKGRWRIEVMHANGHYFAVTPRQKIMNTTCARAKSKTIDVM